MPHNASQSAPLPTTRKRWHTAHYDDARTPDAAQHEHAGKRLAAAIYYYFQPEIIFSAYRRPVCLRPPSPRWRQLPH